MPGLYSSPAENGLALLPVLLCLVAAELFVDTTLVAFSEACYGASKWPSAGGACVCVFFLTRGWKNLIT